MFSGGGKDFCIDLVKLALKQKYIPLCASGEISVRKCARLIGIAPFSAWRLKQRYLESGDSIWIHGNTGRKPRNKKYDYKQIRADYGKFSGTPFAAFRDNCGDFLQYKTVPSYTTVYNALTTAGIISPRARIPVREKKKHLPRKERPNEGDLMQVDGSSHEWLLGQGKTCIHGGIDDATHKITALYMCQNECKLGYYALMRRTYERFGGFPRAIYSDKSTCFFTIKENLGKVTIQEQLQGMRDTPTEWQIMAKKLSVDLIAALSPQAKGRIERLWQTLQGRLPYIFRFLKIDTIEKANVFLDSFVDDFNSRFSVPAQETKRHWRKPPPGTDLDFLLSVKTEKKTKADGSFLYHGYKFRLLAQRAACVKFILCLSENYGIRAYMSGNYYDVELAEPVCDVTGDKLTAVEKDLIYRYFYADTHSGRALVRAG